MSEKPRIREMKKTDRRISEQKAHVRHTLLEAGVRNLMEFGYPSVNTENITKDYIFRKFFRSMLEQTLEEAPRFKTEIEALMAEIDAETSGP